MSNKCAILLKNIPTILLVKTFYLCGRRGKVRRQNVCTTFAYLLHVSSCVQSLAVVMRCYGSTVTSPLCRRTNCAASRTRKSSPPQTPSDLSAFQTHFSNASIPFSITAVQKSIGTHNSSNIMMISLSRCPPIVPNNISPNPTSPALTVKVRI